MDDVIDVLSIYLPDGVLVEIDNYRGIEFNIKFNRLSNESLEYKLYTIYSIEWINFDKQLHRRDSPAFLSYENGILRATRWYHYGVEFF